MFAAMTGMGLSAAAGLNAFIPYLVIACVARFTDLVNLPPTYAWMTSWWSIGIASALLLVEVFLDKIPAVDSANDTIQTFVRPAMGGLIATAVQAASQLDSSQWLADRPWLTVIGGVVMSGLVHTAKVAARPVINAGTFGMGAPVVSTAEDGFSLGASVLALFVPVIVVLLFVVFLGAAGYAVWRFSRRRRVGAQRSL